MFRKAILSGSFFFMITALPFNLLASNNQFNSTIPVIDMNDFYSRERHQIFIDDLASAMQEVGFVAIVNARVNKDTLDNAYAVNKEFYARSNDYKMSCNAPELNGQRGYVASESAKGSSIKDFKEFYHLSREYPIEIRKNNGYPANVWPNHFEYKNAMLKLIAELDTEAEAIGQALAESLGKDKNFFNDMTRNGNYVMRTIHYPANPPKNAIWAREHTDIDLFTILPRATVGGLQVLNADKEWIDVVVPDGAFIVNAGDMLENITNGIYKSSMHRVICSTENVDRYSIVAFIQPRNADSIAPLPEFIVAADGQKYAEVTAEELLAERLIDLGLHTKALLEKFAASGAPEKLIKVGRASPEALRALKDANQASASVLDELDRLAEHRS